MASAAANRASGVAPAAAPSVRSKPHRVTLDLPPATFRDLNQWIGQASAEVGGRVTLAEGLRGMIRVMLGDDRAGALVVDDLRASRGDDL